MNPNTPVPPGGPDEKALAAKIAAEGVYEIESQLYSKLAPALASPQQPAKLATAGESGPNKRILLINNGDAPVFLSFAIMELRAGGVPTSRVFLLPPGIPPMVLVLRPGQSIWGRSSTGDQQRVSVATSVVAP